MNRWIYVFIILVILILLLLYLYIRKAYAVRKVCGMTIQDKLARISQLGTPFGFEYKLSLDAFTSTADAWQRECGYCTLYDRQAPVFHMIFDCEPVYFDYKGATWLIEHLERSVRDHCRMRDRHIQGRPHHFKEERKSTLFHSITDEEMPVFSVTLLKDGAPVSRLCERHWWLTAFLVGRYAEPESLSMKATIIFPDEEMCTAFLAGLDESGYEPPNLYVSGEAAAFTFSAPHTAQPFLRSSFYSRWVLYKNRVLLSLFLQLTKPFRFTLDRLLLLYEYLPVLFRHILKLRRTGHNRRRKI